MAFYRGNTGSASLGGQLAGNAFLAGGLAAGALACNVDGNGGTLAGVVAPGDQFTVAGEAGSPVHTVGSGALLAASANAIAGIPFTPAIAAGGAANHAAVNFLSNAIAQVTKWSLSTTLQQLDSTVMGDAWESVIGGRASWKGTLELRLDLGDTRQSRLVAMLATATPPGVATALTLGVERTTSPVGAKQFSGGALLVGARIESQDNNLVTVTFDFTGSGNVTPTWA